MFHKKEIEIYRTITAPETLKKRVMDTANRPAPKPWYARTSSLVTAFACLAILLSTAFLLNFTSPNVVVLADGVQLGKTPVELSDPSPYAKANNFLEDNSFSTLLEIKVSNNTTIIVSGGTIYDTENSQYGEKNITIDGDTTLCWSLDNKKDSDPYYMTVNTDQTIYKYILEQNKESGIWTMSQQ